MMSVGRTASPLRYACVRDQCNATRPAATYAVANAHVLITWADRSGGADTSARTERTAIPATDVAIRTTRRSSRSS